MLLADEALQEWGRRKLKERYPGVEHHIVNVDVEIDPGYQCCGGSDPHCYCSYAESPSIQVEIRGFYGKRDVPRHKMQVNSITTSEYNYNFPALIREIVAVAQEVDGERG